MEADMTAGEWLVSIRPQYARAILAGTKTVEIRRLMADTSMVEYGPDQSDKRWWLQGSGGALS